MDNFGRKLVLAVSFAAPLFVAPAASAYFIDFEQGEITGGSFSCLAGDCTGTDIPFNIIKADTDKDGVEDYISGTVDALLNFDTAANTLNLVGSISDLGIAAGTTLLTGSFDGYSFSSVGGGITTFLGFGPDTKSDTLLTALGIPLDTEWRFATFQLQSNGTVQSADILNTTVPEPAILSLFGLGLIGIAFVRRGHAKGTVA